MDEQEVVDELEAAAYARYLTMRRTFWPCWGVGNRVTIASAPRRPGKGRVVLHQRGTTAPGSTGKPA